MTCSLTLLNDSISTLNLTFSSFRSDISLCSVLTYVLFCLSYQSQDYLRPNNDFSNVYSFYQSCLTIYYFSYNYYANCCFQCIIAWLRSLYMLSQRDSQQIVRSFYWTVLSYYISCCWAYWLSCLILFSYYSIQCQFWIVSWRILVYSCWIVQACCWFSVLDFICYYKCFLLRRSSQMVRVRCLWSSYSQRDFIVAQFSEALFYSLWLIYWKFSYISVIWRQASLSSQFFYLSSWCLSSFNNCLMVYLSKSSYLSSYWICLSFDYSFISVISPYYLIFSCCYANRLSISSYFLSFISASAILFCTSWNFTSHDAIYTFFNLSNYDFSALSLISQSWFLALFCAAF